MDSGSYHRADGTSRLSGDAPPQPRPGDRRAATQARSNPIPGGGRLHDVAGSTELAARIGDEGWKRLLERHLRQARAALRQFGGREIDTARRWAYATFQSPFQAVAFALDVEERAEALGIQLRSGIHMGEVEEIGGKSGGIAVHIGARIAGTRRARRGARVEHGARSRGRRCVHVRGPREPRPQGRPGTLDRVQRASGRPRSRRDCRPRHDLSVRDRGAARARSTRRGRVARAPGRGCGRGGPARQRCLLLQPRYLPGVEANSVGHIAAGGAGILGALKAGSLPDAIAVGEGSLWVTDAGNGTVARVDLADSRVTDTIEVGNTPSSVAVGHGAVWVANAGDRTVSRISPATGKEVARSASGMGLPTSRPTTAGSGSTNRLDGTLARIDPAANVATTYAVGTTPTGVATGAGSVWVSDFDAGAVIRVDPRVRGDHRQHQRRQRARPRSPRLRTRSGW